MRDKPKSLSEQLTELARWLDSFGNVLISVGWRLEAGIHHKRAAEVRAMAEQVSGKVFTSPYLIGPSEEGGNWSAWVDECDTGLTGYGITLRDAVVNLQSLLDQQTSAHNATPVTPDTPDNERR